MLYTCETVAAIVIHAREGTYPNYSGHVDKPKALCGKPINWDTKLPLSAVTCRACLAALFSPTLSIEPEE